MERRTIENRKGEKIVVIVEKANPQKGVAFLTHGLGGFKEQGHIEVMAKAFFEKNYTVLRFDATNSSGESHGKLENATATNYYEDLQDVIEWSKSQDWYQEPFCLAGHSLGGFCSFWYAVNHLEKVKALAPISTFVSGRLYLEKIKESVDMDQWEKAGYREWESSTEPGLIKRLKWSFAVDSLKYDLLESANKIKVPVLMIVGELDEATILNHQQSLYDKLETKKELHVIKGGPHTFQAQHHLDEIKSIFLNWINSLDN